MEIIKIQRIPNKGGWIQPDILTRMLVWLVNLNFLKSRKSDFFCLKNREIVG